jgi:ABC-2 type transport system permease protein
VFVVLQASAFVGVFTGIAIAADFESGFGRRLLLAAQHRLGILAGCALGAAFRTIAIVLPRVWLCAPARCSRVQGCRIPVFLVLFLAPVYVPRELLAGWVAAAADVNPFTPIVEAGRNLVAWLDVATGLAFGSALALVAVTAVWAIRGLRAAERAGG